MALNSYLCYYVRVYLTVLLLENFTQRIKIMPKNLFTLLKNISELIAKKGEYNSVLQQIVTMLAEDLTVDVCSIYEYIKHDNKLLLVANHGLENEPSIILAYSLEKV